MSTQQFTDLYYQIHALYVECCEFLGFDANSRMLSSTEEYRCIRHLLSKFVSDEYKQALKMLCDIGIALFDMSIVDIYTHAQGGEF